MCTGLILSLKPTVDRWTDQMAMCLVLTLGSGVQITIYCVEVVSHIYCPIQNGTWFDHPRMFECYRKFND